MPSLSYADQLLEGIANAIELEIWDIAESLAKTLAIHIQATGEYPEHLPREHIERMIGSYRQTQAHGPN
ncbi:MAG: hypothetical protein KTR25_20955 [Myxococcales bacterium]|nr:hypothetical protein [Myxococcales bacterium]